MRWSWNWDGDYELWERKLVFGTDGNLGGGAGGRGGGIDTEANKSRYLPIISLTIIALR